MLEAWLGGILMTSGLAVFLQLWAAAVVTRHCQKDVLNTAWYRIRSYLPAARARQDAKQHLEALRFPREASYRLLHPQGGLMPAQAHLSLKVEPEEFIWQPKDSCKV